jgi:hypothetical protein
MTRWTDVGGRVYQHEDAEKETVCEECHNSVDYTWNWYDDTEMEIVEIQVDDGEKSIMDWCGNGLHSGNTKEQRFNKLHAQ